MSADYPSSDGCERCVWCHGCVTHGSCSRGEVFPSAKEPPRECFRASWRCNVLWAIEAPGAHPAVRQ